MEDILEDENRKWMHDQILTQAKSIAMQISGMPEELRDELTGECVYILTNKIFIPEKSVEIFSFDSKKFVKYIKGTTLEDQSKEEE